MSIEPDTNAKVILKTTLGDLEIELWGKECPLACRNFIQLSMEGYYNGCQFHRLVKGFIAQSGDPSGTGSGGDSIYGHPFKDEFHSRLRFNRRGLLGMVSSKLDDNRSQFFITLDKADELTKRNTLFGRIVGDSLFNILQINELEVDDQEKPLFPPKILSCKVLTNPFTDIKPREIKVQTSQSQQKSTKKRNTTKNLGLLSFGDEEDQDQDPIPIVKPPISKTKPTEKQKNLEPIELVQDKLPTIDNTTTTTTITPTTNNNITNNSQDQSQEEKIQSFSEKMRNQILEKGKKREREEPLPIVPVKSDTISQELGEPKEKKTKVVGSLQLKTVQGLSDYKPSIKPKKISDINILEKLNKFKTNLQKSTPTSNTINNDNQEESWKFHKLEFKKEDTVPNEDHYVVYEGNNNNNQMHNNNNKNNNNYRGNRGYNNNNNNYNNIKNGNRFK